MRRSRLGCERGDALANKGDGTPSYNPLWYRILVYTISRRAKLDIPRSRNPSLSLHRAKPASARSEEGVMKHRAQTHRHEYS